LVVLADWELRAGDAFELIDELDDSSVQLTMSSPPYNIGKSYESRVALEHYLDPYRALIKRLFRKTAAEGVVCWQVGNHVRDRVVVPLDCLFFPLFSRRAFCPGTGSSGTFATAYMPNSVSRAATKRS
jgi:hypothetical protein